MKATTHAWKHHGKGLPNSSMISHGRKSVPVIARRAAGHLATISSNRPRSGLPLTIGGKLPRASTFLFLQSSILQMIWAPSWRATVLRTTWISWPKSGSISNQGIGGRSRWSRSFPTFTATSWLLVALYPSTWDSPLSASLRLWNSSTIGFPRWNQANGVGWRREGMEMILRPSAWLPS